MCHTLPRIGYKIPYTKDIKRISNEHSNNKRTKSHQTDGRSNWHSFKVQRLIWPRIWYVLCHAGCSKQRSYLSNGEFLNANY